MKGGGGGRQICKGRGFALLILSQFSEILHENKIICEILHENKINYFNFMGYLKTGDGWWGFERTP